MFGFLAIITITAPTTASAASADDLTFTLINEGTEYAVTDCFEFATGALDIPATYNGKPVTQIGDNAFRFCNFLTSISIPEGVTEIGVSAFSDCNALTSISIPEGVTEIGDSAFWDCDELTSISIPEGVTEIGDSAFYNCDELTSISIPEGVTSIADETFYSCDRLTSISLPEGLTSIGDSAFFVCPLTSLTLPSTVTSIGVNAFGGCDFLTSIKLPEGLIVIEAYTFIGCGLTSISLPSSLTAIGANAFDGCDALDNIYFAGPPPSFGVDVFANRHVSSDLITFHVTEENLASYEALNLGNPLVTYLPWLYDGSVRYSVSSRYDAENLRFILVSKNEDNRLNTLVQYTDDLASDQWTTLSSLSYLEATSSADSTVTRTLSNIDPAITPSRFYRLHSDL